MTQVIDAQLKKVAVVLLDGPMDGQRFKVPLLPPSRKIPDSLDLPLKQPASSSPYALYKLSFNEPVAGFFVYLFAGFSSPDGNGVLFAPTFSNAVSSVRQQAGALDLASNSAPGA